MTRARKGLSKTGALILAAALIAVYWPRGSRPDVDIDAMYKTCLDFAYDDKRIAGCREQYDEDLEVFGHTRRHTRPRPTAK